MGVSVEKRVRKFWNRAKVQVCVFSACIRNRKVRNANLNSGDLKKITSMKVKKYRVVFPDEKEKKTHW